MTGLEAEVAETVEALRTTPVELRQARMAAQDGGLPAEAGFYAWWAPVGAIPGVPLISHPRDAVLGLFYVGISPARATSSQTIRARVVNNHLSGNLGSSTFRLTLAALLLDSLDLHPEKTRTKVVLPGSENQRLSDWQETNLRLTWSVCPEPWLIEGVVIDAMSPPLNLAENHAHPFYQTVSKARRNLRASATERPSNTSPPT